MLFNISKQFQEWKKKAPYTPWLMIHHPRGYSAKIFLPVHKLHLIKSQPFYIPEAQKWNPFWATPTSIGLYREYLPPPPSSFYNINLLVLPFTWNLFDRSFVVQIIYFFGFYKKESFLCKFYFGHRKNFKGRVQGLKIKSKLSCTLLQGRVLLTSSSPPLFDTGKSGIPKCFHHY